MFIFPLRHHGEYGIGLGVETSQIPVSLTQEIGRAHFVAGGKYNDYQERGGLVRFKVH